jgi:hypothetical protein
MPPRLGSRWWYLADSNDNAPAGTAGKLLLARNIPRFIQFAQIRLAWRKTDGQHARTPRL